MTAWIAGSRGVSTASTVEPAETGDREHPLGDDDAADQERDADADHRHDRHRGIAQRVAHQHAALAEALGACGADVVLVQHLEHRGARDARDQRDVDDRQGQRTAGSLRSHGRSRWRGGCSPAPAASRARWRSQISSSRSRRPASRSPAPRSPSRARSSQRAVAVRREHAERHRDQHRDDSVSAASDRVGSMRWRDQLDATVCLKNRASPRLPCSMLPDHLANCASSGWSSPSVLAHARDIGRGRRVAGDQRRRIARREPESSGRRSAPPSPAPGWWRRCGAAGKTAWQVHERPRADAGSVDAAAVSSARSMRVRFLLDVPEHVTGALTMPLTTPWRTTARRLLANRRHQPGLVGLDLDRLGQALAHRRVGGRDELALQLLDLRVVGPAEPPLLAVDQSAARSTSGSCCHWRPSR